MISTSCRRTWTGALVALGTLAAPVMAQDACPSVSGPDAEAGWAAYQDGDMEAARTLFTRAIGRCDNDQYARTGLGYVALRNGDTAGADGFFQRVIEAEPNNVDALVGLGLGAWRGAELEAVRSYFGRVIELSPGHPTAAEYLARLDGDADPSTGPVDPADRAWAAEELDLAFDLYSARLDRDPTDGLALLRAGQMHSWREEFAAALELLDLLIDLEPTNIDGRLARARVYAWSGDIPRAIGEVGEALDIVPDNADALATLGLFQAWSGRMDDALASYDRALSIAPEHQAGRRQQAQARAWATQNEASLAAYEALVAEKPEDTDARLGLAAALAFSDDFAGSLREYDVVLGQAPDEMRAHTGRARTLMWAGRLVEAERAALRAIEVDGASGAAWASLGEVYRAQNRDPAARDAFETATGFAPSNPEVRDQLRSVDLALSPDLRPAVTGEDDSDGNRMVTTSVDGAWRPMPRLDVRVRGYYRSLEQFTPTLSIERTAYGGTVTGVYQAWPGWLLTAGAGASATDGTESPQFLSMVAGVRTPDRHPLGLTLTVSSQGLDETALLAERGVRATQAVLAGRWFPDAYWRVDGSFDFGEYSGADDNGRRGWFAGVSRRMWGDLSLGVSHRGFSFEKNVNDGYFDPDFYGIVELTSYWLYRPSPWSLLVEVAPGAEQVRSDGDASATIRANTRVGYLVGPSREVSFSVGYSSAGLSNFATGDSGYRYLALVLGVTWVL